MKLKFLHLNLTIFCLLLTCITSMAQTGSITGNVVDTKNQAVLFATVALKGTTIGTTSDLNGKFEIDNLNAGTYTVVVSFVGYKDFSQDVSVGTTATIINIQLTQDYQSLNEVVVVGYGTKKVKDLTGSVTSVSTKDFLNGNLATPEQLIQGKIAGVQITSKSGAPGAGSTIRIRGGSSLNASNDPLIVIDGVPIDNDVVNGATNGLDLINPNDIENITVLKDASAAAIYGSRAANGVIMITTKKGSSDKLHIEFSTNNSISSPIGYVSMLTADQLRTAVDSNGNTNQQKLLGTSNTNWQKQVFRDAFSTDNDLAFSGGIKNLPYRLSLEFLNDNGILLRNQMQRGAVSLNLSPTFLNNSLKVNLHYKLSYNRNNFSTQGAIGTSVYFDPTQTIYNDTSKFGGYFEWLQKGAPIGLAPKNPIGMIYQRNDISHVYENIGNIEINYALPFFPELKADLNVGGDVVNSNGTVVVPPTAASNFNAKVDSLSGLNNFYNEYKENKLLEFYLNYSKYFKSIKSTIDATAGYSYQSWYTDIPAYPNLSFTSDTISKAAPFPNKFQNVLISFYGRLNYTLAEKYLLTFTLRDDGSSRFAPDVRWGLFPSAALAWRISEENFVKGWKALSNLKLRLGYGETGQQDIGSDYPYIGDYQQGTSTAQYGFGQEFFYVLRPDGYDANIKWETTTTENVGLDFGFINGRISGSIDYYYKPTTDLLATIPVPAGTNFTNNILTNVGSLVNKGVEFSVDGIPFDNSKFRLEIGGNITFNNNEITKLTKVPDTTTLGILVGQIGGGTGNTIQIQSVGFPINTFYVYQQIYNDTTGKPEEGKYVDQNGDGKINPSDLIRYKSPNPKYYASIYVNASYKNWFAGIALRGQEGNYMYNNVASGNAYFQTIGTLGFLSNIQSDYLYTNFQKQQLFSSYYIQDASFIKCDNINLGYNFKKVFSDNVSLRLSAIVQNVFTITSYTGLDPEIQNGIDNVIYPRPRIYSLALNLQL